MNKDVCQRSKLFTTQVLEIFPRVDLAKYALKSHIALLLAAMTQFGMASLMAGSICTREKDSHPDIAVVAACFCLFRRCSDWFIALDQAIKTETIFVFRALFYNFIDSETAFNMFSSLIPAVTACQSLALFDDLRGMDLREAEVPSLQQIQRRWTTEEDEILFAAILQDQIPAFKKMFHRNGQAIRRRIEYWITAAKHLLSFTPDNVHIKEDPEEEEDSEDDTEDVIGSSHENPESGTPESEATLRDTSAPVEGEFREFPGNTPFTNRMTLGRKNVEAALAGRRLARAKREHVTRTMEVRRSQKKVKACLRENDRLTHLLSSATSDTWKTPTEMHDRHNSDEGNERNLVRRVVSFAELQVHSRREYQPDIKWFWMKLFSISPYAFKHFTDMIGGPSLNTIKGWMRKEKRVLRKELFELDNVTAIVLKWIEKWGHTDDVYTLSYDACKLDEDLRIDEKGRVTGTLEAISLAAPPVEYKLNYEMYRNLWERQIEQKNLITHAFVFMLTPVSEARGYPIHVVFSNTGSANEKVFKCIQEIPSRLEKLGIQIAFLASDSDNKYRTIFNQHFRCIYNQFGGIYDRDESGEIRGLGSLQVPRVKCCNDIPHILKRWRSRLVKNNLFVSAEMEARADAGEDVGFVNSEVLRIVNPNIPSSAFRNGAMASMDDAYPLMIFTTETLLNAWDKGARGMFMFLLPAVCAQIVFRAEISRERRLTFAYLGLFLCVYYFSYLEDCTIIGQKFKSPIFTKDLLVDMTNALICQICGMCQVAKQYKTSKISSTISEHYFARMRRTMGQDQSSDNFTRVFLRNVICDLADKRMNENLTMMRRNFSSAICEDGLARLDPSIACQIQSFVNSLGAELSVSFSPRAIYRTVFSVTSGQNMTDNSIVISWFTELISTFAPFSRFTIHAGQTRVRRIYGRSIISRFTTAARRECNSEVTVAEQKWMELEYSL